MRSIFLLWLCTLFFVLPQTSCNKNKCDLQESTKTADTSEIHVIENYLNSKGITATQAPSGFFYVIGNAGSGTRPNLCSSVTVKYKGTLLNGSVFDQSTSNVSFPLQNLIVGWQKGLPLIQKGGQITLYIPPSLGYGSYAQSGIPANSTLIFDIDLVGVVQ
ncbi:MAG TPA: FKBP-type peptidyl-prolyl cis-trans isomerase [Chitinophagaceae bacterium]|nr:FKBP-type peptidyl-prolyl cis-trans isomerase [Chitinophagaceae bacterium]HNF71292.1 FKBP-type peptidyl-prolyl cis-trans isomerase [Chitinophagaceae bacterium]